MNNSALEILIIPVVWGTLGSVVAGAVILGAKKTVEALVGHLGRNARSMKMGPLATRREVPRTSRPFNRRITSVG